MKTLNIIGAGTVGCTLGRLWHERGVLQLGDVLNRSLTSSEHAVEFIGGGRPLANYRELHPADIIMISASDDSIASCCRDLADSGSIIEGSVVFHCSGALESNILASAAKRGAWIASIHPVKSFADAKHAVETFAGTYCAAEGDPQALRVLGSVFERLGAITVSVHPEFKTIYHAALVIACNYLVALLEVAIRAGVKSGMSRSTALRFMAPLVRETVKNVIDFDTMNALTGPIARGDYQVVARQYEALKSWDSQVAEIYADLGRVALQLARARGEARFSDLSVIGKLLQG